MLDPVEDCAKFATEANIASALAAVSAANISVCPRVMSIAARKVTERRAVINFSLKQRKDKVSS